MKYIDHLKNAAWFFKTDFLITTYKLERLVYIKIIMADERL